MDRRPHKDLFTRRWRHHILPAPKEVFFHIQLVELLRWCIRPDVLWFHVSNGEELDKRIAAKRKAMGVLPGVADLIFFWFELENGEKRTRVLHLELKRPHVKPSESQLAMALWVQLLGMDYQVAHSIDEAVEILGKRGLIRSDVTVCGKRWDRDLSVDRDSGRVASSRDARS